MSKIPTAEEYLNSKYNSKGYATIKTGKDKLVDVMREFTKFHVKAALEAAGELADDWENSGELKPEILESYPLDNIK